MKHPEFLKVGQRLVFREGRTKAVGNVTKIIPHAPAGSATQGHKGKPMKLTRNEQRNKGMVSAAAVANESSAGGQGSTKVNGGGQGSSKAENNVNK